MHGILPTMREVLKRPLTQVAENMTVITAKEIEVMNANSINEVLARVPGVFVDYTANDFSSTALGLFANDTAVFSELLLATTT